MSDANASQPDTILARLHALVADLRPHIHPDQEEAITRHTMLVARAVRKHTGPIAYGWGRDSVVGPAYDWERDARSSFPLPPRKVLREEPDPDGADGKWRWDARHAQLQYGVGEDWRGFEYLFGPAWDRSFAPTRGRIRLWASLEADPWREEPQ